MDLNITTGERPVISRASTAEPNPFDGRFPTEDGKALVVPLPGTATEKEAKAQAEKVCRLARKAANAAVSEENPDGYTARSQVAYATEGTGKNVKHVATVTVWSVKREKRPGSGRKPATPAAS